MGDSDTIKIALVLCIFIKTLIIKSDNYCLLLSVWYCFLSPAMPIQRIHPMTIDSELEAQAIERLEAQVQRLSTEVQRLSVEAQRMSAEHNATLQRLEAEHRATVQRLEAEIAALKDTVLSQAAQINQLTSELRLSEKMCNQLQQLDSERQLKLARDNQV